MRDLNLLKEDKAVLESIEWLNDRIIQSAHNLLRKKSGIDGFQSPLLGLKLKVIKARSPFIQIININNNHWVTVTNKLGDNVFNDNVYVYDSLLPLEITMSLQKQVCTFFKVSTKYLTFNVVDMMGQKNSYDCGLFAIAVATDIIHGRNPGKSRWSTPDMRPHLIQCLEKANITPFPITEEREIRFCRTLKFFRNIEVHCACRMPFDPNEDGGDMIKCNLCGIWFHQRCISDVIENVKNSNWFCNSCSCLMK